MGRRARQPDPVHRLFRWRFFTNSSTWANAIVRASKSAASQAVAGLGRANRQPAIRHLRHRPYLAQEDSRPDQHLEPGLERGPYHLRDRAHGLLRPYRRALILALVESYVVISAGVLFMGFGGSRFTKDLRAQDPHLRRKRRRQAVRAPALVGLGSKSSTSSWRTFRPIAPISWSALGCAIVMLALDQNIPDMIQGLINGTSTASAGAWWAARSCGNSGRCGRSRQMRSRRLA